METNLTNVKTCIECNHSLDEKEFSLKRGKHVSERKNICVTCESKIKVAKRKYDLTPRQVDKLLQRPCYICGKPSKHIDISKMKKVYSTLCKSCYDHIKLIAIDGYQEQLLGALNYFTIRTEFPFLLLHHLTFDFTEERPLLDYMNEKANSSS